MSSRRHSKNTKQISSESRHDKYDDDDEDIASKIQGKHKRVRKSTAEKANGRSSMLMLSGLVLVLVGVMAYYWYSSVIRDIVRTPLQAPKITETSLLNHSDLSRFWGSYRSGLYFGMKTRSPHSPVVGLMWMTQYPTGSGMQPSVRHWCDQNDGLPSYGWIAHDGISFGVQDIVDHHYLLSTDFVKRAGGNHGGEWSARFRVKPRSEGVQQIPMSLFVYMALDNEGQLAAQIDREQNHLLAIEGHATGLGDFRLVFPESNSNVKTNYLVGYSPSLDKVKDVLMGSLRVFSQKKSKNDMTYIGLVGKSLPEGMPESRANFIVYQVTTSSIPFELMVSFESGSMNLPRQPLTGSVYENELMLRYNQFVKQFDTVFPLSQKGFDSDHVHFARALVSNMLGSIGYFYGSSLVRSRLNPDPIEYWPSALLTAVPSRSFFPRGFLWDEGFHQLLISRWDESLSREIIGHWLDLMNIEGWIPREQILGSEARARVPSEFVVQFNENANPPALFLPLRKIVKNLIKNNNVKDRQYLRALYPRLRSWYSWFNRTQAGKLPSSYRWRGRNMTAIHELNPKTLTSGLDDYPRSSHPTEDERHVDLRCWMAFASGVMANLAEALNESNARFYRLAHTTLNDNRVLDELHWSEKMQRYSDYGLHTDGVILKRPKAFDQRTGQPLPPKEKERFVKREPEYGFVDSSFGYVSLFPFLLCVLEPQSPRLTQILIDLKKPELLWTPYGLRSLSRTSPLYAKHNTEHDPPYWRGSIWININYLALSALQHYSVAAAGTANGDLAESVYQELRKNIVQNVYTQYRSTGYVWEQYNDSTGAGKGSHPFTGWSALVVSIMTEEYY